MHDLPGVVYQVQLRGHPTVADPESHKCINSLHDALTSGTDVGKSAFAAALQTAILTAYKAALPATYTVDYVSVRRLDDYDDAFQNFSVAAAGTGSDTDLTEITAAVIKFSTCLRGRSEKGGIHIFPYAANFGNGILNETGTGKYGPLCTALIQNVVVGTAIYAPIIVSAKLSTWPTAADPDLVGETIQVASVDTDLGTIYVITCAGPKAGYQQLVDVVSARTSYQHWQVSGDNVPWLPPTPVDFPAMPGDAGPAELPASNNLVWDRPSFGLVSELEDYRAMPIKAITRLGLECPRGANRPPWQSIPTDIAGMRTMLQRTPHGTGDYLTAIALWLQNDINRRVGQGPAQVVNRPGDGPIGLRPMFRLNPINPLKPDLTSEHPLGPPPAPNHNPSPERPWGNFIPVPRLPNIPLPAQLVTGAPPVSTTTNQYVPPGSTPRHGPQEYETPSGPRRRGHALPPRYLKALRHNRKKP